MEDGGWRVGVSYHGSTRAQLCADQIYLLHTVNWLPWEQNIKDSGWSLSGRSLQEEGSLIYRATSTSVVFLKLQLILIDSPLSYHSKFPPSLVNISVGLVGWSRPSIPNRSEHLVAMPFSSCSSFALPFLVHMDWGKTMEYRSRSPESQTYSLLIFLHNRPLPLLNDQGLVTPAAIMIPLITCWAFGTRSIKWLGSSQSLRCNGTLTVPPNWRGFLWELQWHCLMLQGQ